MQLIHRNLKTHSDYANAKRKTEKPKDNHCTKLENISLNFLRFFFHGEKLENGLTGVIKTIIMTENGKSLAIFLIFFFFIDFSSYELSQLGDKFVSHIFPFGFVFSLSFWRKEELARFN